MLRGQYLHRLGGALIALMALATPAFAADPALLCSGNEPAWSLDLRTSGQGRFTKPDGTAIVYRGAGSALKFHPETVWRGRAVNARGGELVAFIRAGACSDGMSNIVHPYDVNVSLPDGRHLRGCCRVPADTAALENVSWRLTMLPGQTLPAAGPSSSLTVRFSEGRVSGFSGCNQFTGGYRVQGHALTLGPIGGTLMACPEPAMALEQAFRAAFSGTMRIAVSGDELTLTPESGQEPLRFKREAAPRLDGIVWEVTGYNNGRQAVVSPKLDTHLTIEFKDDQVSGSSGCNRFHGAFKAKGDALSIGPLATTRMMCDAAVMTQERAFLAALETATSWQIARGVLDVHRADGERVLWAHQPGQ